MLRFIYKFITPAAFSFIFLNVALADEIAITDLPKNVVQSVQTKHPGAEIVKAEKELSNGSVEKYEIEIKLPNGNKQEVEIAPDGRILESGD